MPGVSRINKDSAGGTIIGNLAPSVIVEGDPVAVVGAAVAPHGDGPHASPVMAQGSGAVFANGISVCRAGDPASCGHAAMGSGAVFAG